MSKNKLLWRMSCGNCAGTIFRIFGTSDREQGKMVVECTHCQSTSEITVRSEMVVDFGKDSNGVLCVMPDEVLTMNAKDTK